MVTGTRKRCNAEVVEMGTAPHSGPRTSTPREPTAGPPGDTTTRVPPPPEAVPDQHHQLDRQLAVLEGARAELESGWVQGRWWEVTAGGHPGHVDGACLVGALIRAGSGRNSENSKSNENSKNSGNNENSESGENSARGPGDLRTGTNPAAPRGQRDKAVQ